MSKHHPHTVYYVNGPFDVWRVQCSLGDLDISYIDSREARRTAHHHAKHCRCMCRLIRRMDVQLHDVAVYPDGSIEPGDAS